MGKIYHYTSAKIFQEIKKNGFWSIDQIKKDSHTEYGYGVYFFDKKTEEGFDFGKKIISIDTKNLKIYDTKFDTGDWKMNSFYPLWKLMIQDKEIRSSTIKFLNKLKKDSDKTVRKIYSKTTLKNCFQQSWIFSVHIIPLFHTFFLKKGYDGWKFYHSKYDEEVVVIANIKKLNKRIKNI